MFVDIKFGIFWAFAVGLFFQEPLTIGWFLAGIAFALLPDLDFWVEYLKRGAVGGRTLGVHRMLFHNPLVFLPIFLWLFFFVGVSWSTLFLLGVVGHLVHDSMGMGFGVRWLWPFSKKFYKVFSDREGGIHYDRAHLKVISWTPAEAAALTQEKGNDDWLAEDIAYHLKRLPAHLLKIALVFMIGLLISLILKNYT